MDPYIVPKDIESSIRGKLYIVGWLAIRPAWIARLSDASRNHPTFPNPQEWKDFVGIDVVRAMGYVDREKESAEISTKRQKRGFSIKDECGLDWSTLQGSAKIMWRDNVLCVVGENTLDGVSIPHKWVREIIWDLMEHNFRLELLALDRSVFPRHRMSAVGGAQRDLLVLACFPNQAYISLDYPAHDEGLGAHRWEDRMEYVEAFRVLLKDWPGPAAIQLRNMRTIERHSGSTFTALEHEVVRVEEVAYPLYCQTFFDYLGRAPSVPHQLPV